MSKSNCAALLAAAVAMGIGANFASAGSIGINLTTNDRTGATPDSNVGPTESAGFVPQTGWNNVITPFTNLAVTGTGGETATFSLSGATGSWATQDLNGTSGSPDARLMDGYLESNNYAGSPLTVTVSGLDEAVFTGGYNVLLYLTHDEGNNGVRTGSVKLNAGTAQPVTVKSSSPSFSGYDNVADANGINVYTFANVTGTSFTVNTGGADQANRLGFAAIQIVPVPEPASIGLLGLGALGMLGRRRR